MREDSEQRAVLLEKAIEVFAGQGYKGATVRAVGRAAGVNPALIYYYYEDKDTLFRESIRHVLRGFFDHLQAHPADLPDAQARFTYLVDRVFEYFTAVPARPNLIYLSMASHPRVVGQAIREIARRQPLTPILVLAEGIRRGELRPVHPVRMWWSLLGMCLFSVRARAVAAHVGEVMDGLSHLAAEDARGPIVDILMHGLAASPVPRGTTRARKLAHSVSKRGEIT